MKLNFRKDTLANWTASNPVLGSGEPGYENDTGVLRIGDGVTAFLSLKATNRLAFQNVASDTAKLALTGLIAGVSGVIITGEGNRVELYVGGTISSQTSWVILRNSFQLYVSNAADFGIPSPAVIANGVSCASAATTFVGWINDIMDVSWALPGGTYSSSRVSG